ncbi:hypothetical protein [Citricoccus nitrophenolicus]|uniref:hypothetical protein n=1 Tax=Citricoccus nitrophenolicus TaxID=863575 RepID=UPI00366D0E02
MSTSQKPDAQIPQSCPQCGGPVRIEPALEPSPAASGKEFRCPNNCYAREILG